MTTAAETRDLALRLVARETIAGESSVPVESAALHVYEKLRQRLCLVAGVAAFLSLASRALSQAKSEAPDLWAVQISSDGSLQGLGEFEPPFGTENSKATGGGVILIARLLELLLIFLGETLTISVVRDVWPDASFDNCNSVDRRTV